MLSESKFYGGYSRWREKDERYETWEEAVQRVMDMHREKYTGNEVVTTPHIQKILDYIDEAEEAYKDKLVLGAQRALQFGGEQIFKHQARLYNCFHESTSFVTKDGVKTFADFQDGDITTVVTHLGNWKQAKVRSYGVQKLNKVTMKKGSSKPFEVLVTENHRWILKNGTETTALKVGDLIGKPYNTFIDFNYEKATPMEKLYWCYGLVYGDGTRVKDDNGEHKYSMIRLCGHDKQFAGRFEELGFKTSTNNSLKGDFMAYTGTYLKTAPDPEVDSPELIRAFVSGYLQADGAKNNTDTGTTGTGTRYLSIQSSELDHIEFIRKCFPIAGVWLIGETNLEGQKTNFTNDKGRPYTVSFRLTDSFGGKYTPGWKVHSIEEYSSNDTVWCLEVEDDHSFVMPNGLVTGNCSVSYVDRPEFFNECMYLMLCGVGVGFSVSKKNISKLPPLYKRNKYKAEVFSVPDSIEGWSDAFKVLLDSYFNKGSAQVHFDYSQIRPEGAMISGGFKAPGPEGLRKALIKCEKVIESLFVSPSLREGDMTLNNSNAEETYFTSIAAYDFTMHMADAVLSGGVRRSATICVFDKDDESMLKAKTGNWFVDNPQRGRSNNSALIIRDEITREEWANIMKSVKDFGEPGFIFSDCEDFLYNPCVEIGMLPRTLDGRSGFQFCNLTEINGGQCSTKADFLKACRASAILGTLQAGYTDFKYVSSATKEITDREALLGCSITGWMNNPDVLFDKQNMIEGAELIKQVNKEMAALLGINQAARTTAVKPSGNASVLLGTASGIHGEHSKHYFRHVQMNKNDEVAKHISRVNPKMVEDSVWSANGSDIVVAFPISTNDGSIYKQDLLGIKQLEYVKLAQQYWVEYGTNVELCVHPKLRHNVSNTITVDNWDEVEQYLFDNRQWFAGVSLLSSYGDKAYAQAPFTEVFTSEELLRMYGNAAMFASGLIVDGMKAFNDNLWLASDTVLGFGLTLTEEATDLLKRDWVRRAKKFAKNYFNEDLNAMIGCLKDCYNLHKWSSIKNSLMYIDFSKELQSQVYTDVDTMGAQACAGGACDLKF